MMNLPLPELVGFNYSAAALELLKVYTYDELSEKLGYKSKGSISQLLDGVTPSHIQGEALWALYNDTFHRKPPLVRHSAPHLTT